MMDQPTASLKLTIVQLVTVNVEEQTTLQKCVVVCIFTVMKTFNVFVIGKVTLLLCKDYLIILFVTGILCGKCQDGKGLSVLLNKCKSCSKFNLLLISALGIFIAHIICNY